MSAGLEVSLGFCSLSALHSAVYSIFVSFPFPAADRPEAAFQPTQGTAKNQRNLATSSRCCPPQSDAKIFPSQHQ